MTKVEKYLELYQVRALLPGNDVRREHKWMREQYAELSFMITMAKPTERDWADHAFELLKR